MGARGPSAKAAEIRRLEGSLHRVIAFPTKRKPAKPPEELPAEIRQVWQSITDTFAPGHFLAADQGLLEVHCSARLLWRRAHTKIEGLTAKGRKVPSFWLRVRAQAFVELMQTGDRLGIGPGKRTQSVAASLEARRPIARSSPHKDDQLFFKQGLPQP